MRNNDQSKGKRPSTMDTPSADINAYESSGETSNEPVAVAAIKRVPFWKSTRLVVILITFFGMVVFTLMRGVIGFAMICMVNKTAAALQDSSTGEERLRRLNRSRDPECSISNVGWEQDYDGHFVWSAHQQSFIFAAASWGELFADLPAGYLVHRFGPKLLLGLGGALAATATVLTPWAASFGYMAVVAARFFIGVGFATLWPSKSVILATWTVKEERSTALSLVTAGHQLSTVLTMPISATLCTHKNILGGWPAIFYFTTIVVIIWLLLWTFYVKSNPQQHRWMSAREKSYLKANTVTRSGQENINKAMLKIFLQPAVLIIIICQGAATWGMFTLLFYLPQYLRDVMMIDMKKNGLYSAAPFLSQLVFRVCFGVIADLLYKKCHMNRTTVVKLFNTIGFFGLGSLTFGSAFIGCRYSSLAVFTICMGTGLWAAVVAGFVTSMILIVPKYTSIISSCSKFFGTSVSVILPYVIGVVVRDGYQSEWRLIFGLSFGILFVCGLAFVIWGSGEEISIEEKEKAHSKKTNGDNQSYV